jgi:hypothetical protein
LKHPGCHGDRFREFSCRNWGNLLDAKKCDWLLEPFKNSILQCTMICIHVLRSSVGIP